MADQCAALKESESVSPDQTGGWKILHADVARLGPVAIEPGYAGLYLCFWFEQRPLGHCELFASELPLSDLQIRQLAARVMAPAVRSYLTEPDSVAACINGPSVLARLSEKWRQEEATFESRDVSLIICTRNRPERLQRCLESIGKLRFRPAEVVVVDNGTRREETRQVVEEFERVRYVVEPVAGLSRARNSGVRAASCSLIAFTDDDIVVSPDWLVHLVHAVSDTEVSAASGLVFAAELRTESQIAFEQGFGGFHQGYRPRRYGPEFVLRGGRSAPPVWSICAGGNMIVRRTVFDSIGLFDEHLGAGAAGCSEDSEFWYRILASGGICAYAPAAAVFHYHRENAESLQRQIFLYMRGHVAALLTQFRRFRRWDNLHRIAVELPLYYLEAWGRKLLCGESAGPLLTRAAQGSAAGIWYWIRHSDHERGQ